MRSQMVNRKTSCSFCEKSNLASFCSGCVNYRLNEYNIFLKALKSRREPLYRRLAELLVEKEKLDEQRNWRVLQSEKLARLREKVKRDKELLAQDKAKVEKTSKELNAQYGLLESAQKMLEKNRVELLEKFYPNLICAQGLGYMAITSERLHKQSLVIKQICKLFPQRRVTIDGERKDASNGQYDLICNARLPRGLDPHSVPSDELAASLGYMVQLLNIVVQNLAAPALHNSGFAGSCSRIWQRDSYWDPRPSSRSNEYPLFIPRQNYCSTTVENSWSEKSSSNFGVASIESEKRPSLDSTRNTSFNFSAASPHSVETHKDLQRGISLLKKSVACITAYCYNSLCLDVPPEASTFEGFAKLLATLSSSKEVRSILMASSRSYKQAQQLNKSVWHVNSTISSSSLLESAHTLSLMRNIYDNSLLNSDASYMYPSGMADSGKTESGIEGWDFVEHPTFPPPPSQGEDIEHWTRAMIIDATKK
uniref:UV radiation resistance protein/autophagy-related protein 14 n=1 Tax=Kalanchoe fedtschenkoi TaxID=63787 RepID=A0A7N0UN88_KALFE